MADNKDLKKFRGGIRLESTSAPANAETGALYFDSVAKGLKVHDGTQFNDVGSGSSGGLDTFYVEDFRATPAYSATGGTCSIIDDADSLSEKSLKYIPSGTSAESFFCGASDITFYKRQKGKTCSISFYYTYDGADDDFTVQVKDNAGTILTSSSDLLKSTSTAKKFVTTFTIPSGATSLQWGIKKTTDADNLAAYKLIIDDVEISQDPFVQADLGTITEWENITANPTSYFPGMNGSTPPSDMNYRHRRVGDSLEVNISIDVGTSSGTNSNPGMDAGHANLAAFKLPNNLEVDFTKMISMKQVVGRFQYADDNSSNDIYGEASDGGTKLQEYIISAIDNWTDIGTSGDTTYHSKNFLILSERSATGGNTINLVDWQDVVGSSSGNRLLIQATIPIKGWGSPNTHIVTPAKSNLTDWVSYEPATTSTSGGTGHAHTGSWRRIGDSMEVVFELLFGSGTIGTDHAIVGLPTSVATSPWKNDYEVNATSTPHKNRIIGEFWIAQGTDSDLNLVIGDSATHYGDTNRSNVIMFNENYPGFVQLVDQSSSSNSELDSNFTWNDLGAIGPSDRIYGKFTVPIKEWSAQDSNFLAALPMTKWQKKEITSNLTSDGWLTEMQFSNLDKNKSYKLTAHAFLGASGSSTGLNVTPYNGGTDAGDKLQAALLIYESPSSDAQNELVSMTIIFSPKSDGDSTLKFYGTLGSVSDFVGGSGRTFATLEELSMHEETDIW